MSSRFTSRSTDIEIMDDLRCEGEVVDQTLRELETINRLLGGNEVTLSGLKILLSNTSGTEPITIADLGCGGGDILLLIARWGRRKKIPLHLIGVDANPNIINFAKKNTSGFSEITYATQNIFSEEFKQRTFDIVVATLFTHHFSSTELATFLSQLKKQIRIGIVINDIHRHWFAFHSIRILTKLFSRSAMVKFDAPLSVLRSFTRKELEQILAKASIKNYKLKWKWAFRWQLIIPASLA